MNPADTVQDASRAELERYQRLFASLPMPTLLVDRSGYIISANDEAADCLGLSRNAALQRSSLLPFLDHESRKRLFWRLADRSRPYAQVIQGVSVRLGDDGHLPCDLQLMHLDDEGHFAEQSLVMLIDRRAAVELRESERVAREQGQRLAEVIWASQSGTWDQRFDNDELSCNDRWAQIMGHALEDLQPTTRTLWRRIIHPDDWASAQQSVLDCLQRRVPALELNLRVRHRNGVWIWVHIRGRVVEWDRNERALRMVGVMLDATLQRQQEEALQAAKLAADAAHRVQAEFLANLSHEVRTPMNSVMGMAQLLRETPLDARQHELLDYILQGSRLLLDTLNDLLDHAKIESGNLRLERIPIDLLEPFENAQMLFEAQAADKGLALRLHAAPDLPAHLLGDPLRLAQVANNLVSNAVKFTASGSVDIHVGGEMAPDASHFLLRAAVQDTGRGLSAEQIGRLFKPFSQADGSVTREFGGTGLGLSICRQLVGLMGGQIGVDSEPGVGSRFWFTARLDTDRGITPDLPLGPGLQPPESASDELPRVVAATDAPGAAAEARPTLDAEAWLCLQKQQTALRDLDQQLARQEAKARALAQDLRGRLDHAEALAAFDPIATRVARLDYAGARQRLAVLLQPMQAQPPAGATAGPSANPTATPTA